MLAVPMKEAFELVETVFREPHDWRYILRCRGCGQLYLYDFHEVTDRATGNDPTFTTWVPVLGDADLKRLSGAPRRALREERPHLTRDWPADAERPTITLVTGPAPGERMI